ncbi:MULTISPECIES: hypothetical protein [Limnospira]|uniref:Uncharacterized protein n=1 Tax=Limnospira indica PCC 8005 TaxID=376219 RepID=A0A9P1KBA3_9CYAN|nr:MULTISPECIES: hypothetical protein [unclassified Limnospira]EKD10031.1 hypothetical protein SPLC1_S100610 [Arthrospira platensis C1]MDC0839805.1 hypothetical protein [Limnoraphis robusta]MDT9244532.1 hypothetical protein [Limnospira sp. PMC 1249.20]MDT9270240.1 hypothetical protein [Limnospira sp. PMC 1234.20]QJB28471.1 hypothetical protein HFV01_25065 [Limnospira fusiformis SAG 85.79]RAQ38985.1 hypothetical protein B9S53_24320 [Arthrospira sp. O9.13F]CDM92782.1 protein of unknown functio
MVSWGKATTNSLKKNAILATFLGASNIINENQGLTLRGYLGLSLTVVIIVFQAGYTRERIIFLTSIYTDSIRLND